jgi:A/G-specific adenine glycosylase
MDFGATWCSAKQPVCLTQKIQCPFERSCQAKALDQVLAIPKKLPKKKSPQFACAVGILAHGNAVLLQKRPAKAIWGGLWSLPEGEWQAQMEEGGPTVQAESLTSAQLIELILPNRFSKKPSALFGQSVRMGVGVKHIFSHRVLQIQAYEMVLNGKAKKELDRSIESDEAQFIWAELSKLEQYGLAQPIRLLLESWSLARGAAELDQCANASPIV